MNSRTPCIGGNWKMNTRLEEALSLARSIDEGVASIEACVDVVLFPPLPWITGVAEVLSGSPVFLGGQDVSPHEDGPFTGQISAGMLLDSGCTHVLVGHSERRHGLDETNTLLNDKVLAALEAGLQVMLCIGETLEEREAGKTGQVISTQVRECLSGVDQGSFSRMTIAYEPVWAIGTGRTAEPTDAQDVHAQVRTQLADLYDASIAQEMRILYGGSMKPDNAGELLQQADIDGGLIGGASLHADKFLSIITASTTQGSAK